MNYTVSRDCCTNYVYPCFKLEKKVRRGSRYSKTYSPPITPAQRLLECPDASTTVKEQIHSTMAGINPLKLAVEVKELQNKLQKEAIKLRSSYPQKRGGLIKNIVYSKGISFE